MKTLILENQIKDTTVDEWMMSIALIPYPDGNTMEYVHELLNARINTTTVALGVSTLTFTYCKNSPGCEYETKIQGIVEALEGKVMRAYTDEANRNSRRNQEEVIYVLFIYYFFYILFILYIIYNMIY